LINSPRKAVRGVVVVLVGPTHQLAQQGLALDRVESFFGAPFAQRAGVRIGIEQPP
jgi:hypothetical protein